MMLSARQIAERYGIPRATLDTWRREGRGPAYRRLGARMVRYLERDVIAYFEGRDTKEEPPQGPEDLAAAQDDREATRGPQPAPVCQEGGE